jgi:hypothetical protein
MSDSGYPDQYHELADEGYFDHDEEEEFWPRNQDLGPVESWHKEREPLDEEERRVYLGAEDDHYTRLERRGGAR